MTNLALFFTLAFVSLAILFSLWQKIGLEKDIIIGTIRAAIQLIGVGYVLHIIFASDSILFILMMLSVMVIVATLNAASKWKDLKGIKWRIAIAITTTEVITMGLMLGLQIIKPIPQYIIPISGMIIGNAMVVSGLFLNRIKGEMDVRLEEIKVYLALGASSKRAMKMVTRKSVKASMIPMIDGMKTVGLVQLPGMMTGMIVAGANPIEAVRYQLLIMYSLTSSSAIVSIIFALLIHGIIFNKYHQFKNLNTK